MTKREARADAVGGSPLREIIDPTERPRRVFFIGVDAGRYDYLERFNVPNIEGLIDRGVSFRNAVCGSFISETAPGFASIATGVYAKTHGICTSRDWYDRKLGTLQYFYDEQTGQFRIDAPSLGEVWKRSNPSIKVAAISTKDRPSLLLAGPTADRIVYCYNELTTMRALGTAYQGRGVHEDHFAWTERPGHEVPEYLSKIRIPRKVDWIADGVCHFNQDVADVPLIDRYIMDSALPVLDAESPDLFFVTLVSVNMVGHLYGTQSLEIRAAVEETDRQIGRLIDHLKKKGWFDDTLFVIVSDHGMTDRPHAIDIMTPLQSIPDVSNNVAYYLSGASGGLYLKDTGTRAIDEALRAVLAIPHVKGAWYRDDPEAPWFIRKFSHPRAPDILILAEHTYGLVEKGWTRPSVPAHHGPPYPSDVNVWTIFSGPGVKRLGKIGAPLDLEADETISEELEARLPKQVDLHPTIRAICGF